MLHVYFVKKKKKIWTYFLFEYDMNNSYEYDV